MQSLHCENHQPTVTKCERSQNSLSLCNLKNQSKKSCTLKLLVQTYQLSTDCISTEDVTLEIKATQMNAWGVSVVF